MNMGRDLEMKKHDAFEELIRVRMAGAQICK